MKIDLHVHSRFSRRPTQWILQKIGCPESFTEPLQVYRIAKHRGMSMVTITDHNTIDGAMEIAHLPDVFISEEITAYFPEDGCKVHILALDITEAQHLEIGKVRRNIYDLAAYLNQAGILHVLAHPVYAVNDRLSLGHFERMLLLFQNFELNGARNDRQNQNLKSVLMSLTSEDMDRLAEKHGISPAVEMPWRKNIVGGSDDHSGLNIARTYTRIPGAATVEELSSGIRRGRAEVASHASSPRTMAHNLYGIAYQFYRNKFSLSRHTGKDRLLRFLENSLNCETEPESGLMRRIVYFLNYRKQSRARSGMPDTLLGLIRGETDRLLTEHPEIMEAARESGASPWEQERNWFDFVNRISNEVLSSAANRLLDHLSGGNVFSVFGTLGSAGGLYFLLAPYFVAFAQFTKDRTVNRSILERFGRDAGLVRQEVRVAHFTDTFYDVNGVAQTLQQQVDAALRNHKHLTVITCHDDHLAPEAGVRNFKPIGVYEIPEYPEQKVYYPPFLEMLNYCYEAGITHIQAATPGPIGLAALAIASILKLPINGTYHTAFPQYAKYLTGDAMIEELTWRYMLWYYDHMDLIYVSSGSSAEELAAKGIRAEKIRMIPRGIDTEAFHPSRRNGLMKKRYGITAPVKILYVGRVSREKNLLRLAEAFKRLARVTPDVHLVVVGDGPYLEEMRQTMADCPCTFTGYLKGDDLADTYASGDLFVFPSTTDTFGNVVLEAQASGLPIIVTDQGGPCENMVPNVTGLVVPGDDPDRLLDAMQRLACDREMRVRMGRAAREYMEERSFENAFVRQWKIYEEMEAGAPQAAAAAGGWR
ncbi:glycosyltransferase [Desulfococcus sp.]|uniref:glycosyltransferase n=1 Tax=Desulfococcus sp. TaxID=2025834 RepID=UPI003592FF01